MRAILLCARSPIRWSFLRRGSLLIPLSLLQVCFGPAPMAQAVGRDRDGAIPGSNDREGIPTAAPIDGSGIASRYPGDKNIASDPAVIFADDFESYTSVDQIKARWGRGGGLPRMRIATESANVFSGGQSVEFAMPITTVETGISLSRALSPERDTVYIRYYQKFDAGYNISGSSHSGVTLGAHYVGPGIKPPADGTGFFLFFLQNNILNLAGESAPGFSHLYVYWPKQRSQFGDHWYPNGIVIPGGQGDWLLNPSQYPDFRVMPNFQPLRDRWYCVELMVRANTPGQNNGEVKYWIDGQVIGAFPNLNVRSISTLKMDSTQISLHAHHSERVNKKWHDNVVIATKYIGPMVSATTARGDFNRDGKADILWQNSSTGQRVIWLMNGTALQSGVSLGFVPTSWSIVGSSDFNGDGKADILWQNTSSGQRLVWLMNGTTHTANVSLGIVPTSWSIVGSSDFNRDGKSDILWQNTSTGQRSIWLMNGTRRTSTVSLGIVATAWSIRNY
jgi:FG-GAP-like repeat